MWGMKYMREIRVSPEFYGIIGLRLRWGVIDVRGHVPVQSLKDGIIC